ncbi:DUF7266 family protein [Halobiforma nitratireducens]|uniref:Flagellin n=1 Tax=Halobiforma nitratireducens JCM 10879 TaxID=1227454 RepID=M0MB09_9EURY|nr:hypothetical protein [Halobiforma nitratireducens]EMA42941.1 hypothetical protein C446_03806 [Halobiforma nitratireducens JCM 10879]
MTSSLEPDDRGVSVAVTHVLTIGIATILIAMLMMSGATLLETETERSAESSLETIGERLAHEVENVDQMTYDETERIEVTSQQPRTVANSRYTVELLEGENGAGECSEAPLLDGTTDCLRLTGDDGDVYVPLVVGSDIGADDPVTGGTVEIVYDGDELRLEGGNQ